MGGGHGIFAIGADILCDDLQVIDCGYSGVYASKNTTITLRGQGTSIQGNVTKGYLYEYGLKASDYRRPAFNLYIHSTKKTSLKITVVEDALLSKLTRCRHSRKWKGKSSSRYHRYYGVLKIL